MTGDHENRVTDYTAIVVINSSGEGVATTIDSHYYKGCGEREGIEREYVVYSVQGYSKYAETLPTLRASGGDIGGGSEGIVIYEDISENHRGVMCE